MPIVKKLSITSLMIGLVPAGVRADGIWGWSHEASGSGTANLFDGGPPVFREDETEGPDDDRMSFSAYDRTQSGSLGALALASGESRIIEATEDRFRLRVDLTVGYFPSGFPGGDNPGGMAGGELTSVVEFTMPADELQWFYQLLIFEDAPFTGLTSVSVENVTRSEILLQLSSEQLALETVLSATTGERIRISSAIAGVGSMGPGSTNEYKSVFSSTFVVPEVGTVLLLLLGLLGVEFTKRRGLARDR